MIYRIIGLALIGMWFVAFVWGGSDLLNKIIGICREELGWEYPRIGGILVWVSPLWLGMVSLLFFSKTNQR